MTFIFSSCQVRLKGPKLLEHSLATMWHQFKSFHQFFLADIISLTLQAQPLINAIYILSVLSLYTIYKTTAPVYTHKHILKNSSFTSSTKHVHSLPYYYGTHFPIVTLADSYRCWTQMGLSQYDHSHVCICDESTLHYALKIITFIFPPTTLLTLSKLTFSILMSL